MRSQKEIQRAHDVMHFVGSPETPVFSDVDAVRAVRIAHDVLAWVLGFPCGAAFAENLAVALEATQKSWPDGAKRP